jgi:hypothetical protein
MMVMRSSLISRASALAALATTLCVAATASAQAVAEPPAEAPSAPPAASEPAPPVSESSVQPRAPAAAPAAPASSTPKIDLRTPTEKPDCIPEDEPAEGAGVFFIGVGFFDFAALNRRLRANGYEPIDDGITVIGGEGHAILPGGFVVGAHGGGLISSDGRGPNGFERSFGGGFGMLDFGLALVRTQPLLLTLTSGLGGYGMSLGISNRQSASFDDVLQNPARTSSISRGGMLVASRSAWTVVSPSVEWNAVDVASSPWVRASAAFTDRPSVAGGWPKGATRHRVPVVA